MDATRAREAEENSFSLSFKVFLRTKLQSAESDERNNERVKTDASVEEVIGAQFKAPDSSAPLTLRFVKRCNRGRTKRVPLRRTQRDPYSMQNDRERGFHFPRAACTSETLPWSGLCTTFGTKKPVGA